MPHVIRRLEYSEIEITDKPGEEQISAQCARDVIACADLYGCKKDGEWFSYKRTTDKILKCGGWVGTLQSGDRQIEVRPKIETDGAENEVDLVELLIRSGNIDAEFREVASLADRASCLELLALWFARRISKECNRGLSRGYVSVSENIPGKRGRIDFSKQWQNTAMRRTLLACKFDELSEDNQLNRILKAGLRAALSSKTKLPECRIALSNTLKLLEGISDVKITAEEALTFRTERKDLRFKPLLQLAARFISNRRHQDVRPDHDKNDSEGLSLMWSAWLLFESFVFRELSGENRDSKFKIPKNWHIKKQFGGKYMIRRKGIKRCDYLLKPDIVIFDKNGNPNVICDTKWKYDTRSHGDEDASEIAGKKGRYVVKKSDLYQMFAYSRYYATGNFTPSIALIYPSQSAALPTKDDKGPLSFLTKVDTLFFNIGENDSQTRVDIYEFPVPTVVKPVKPATV